MTIILLLILSPIVTQMNSSQKIYMQTNQIKDITDFRKNRMDMVDTLFREQIIEHWISNNEIFSIGFLFLFTLDFFSLI